MNFSLEPGTFKGLIFDCDGTLVETLPAHVQALQDVLQPYGISVPFDWCRTKYGQTNTAVLKAFAEEITPLPAEAATILDAWVKAYRGNLHLLREIPEVCAVARAWYGRVPMAVASNGRIANVRATLRAMELLAFFNTVVSVEEVENGKPAPDLFLEAAGRLGVEAMDCIVFEDSAEGIEAARRAGMRTIQVPSRRIDDGKMRAAPTTAERERR